MTHNRKAANRDTATRIATLMDIIVLRQNKAPPAVSVVVPNYNHARFLPQRLTSVLEQSFSDFELIILDDASTDESVKIIQTYLTDPRVQFHPDSQNSGSPFAQWNKGVFLSHGEFVWIAESDDFAGPDFLSTLVSLLQQHPKAGLACCESWQVDETGNLIDDPLISTTSNSPATPLIINGRDDCRNNFLWENAIPNASAVLFRRQIYENAGMAPADMRLSGDWMTWVRMLCMSDIVRVHERLNYFRQHSASVRKTTSNRVHFDERWRVQRHLLSHRILSAADKRSLAKTVVNEYVSRVRLAPREQTLSELRNGMIACLPAFFSAPFASTKVLIERGWRKTLSSAET